MTGCATAIAIRDAIRAAREWPADCRLAYGLERQFGRVCIRIGGRAVCGACVSGFQKSDTEAAGCGEMGNPMSGSLNGHEVTQRPPLVNSGPS